MSKLELNTAIELDRFDNGVPMNDFQVSLRVEVMACHLKVVHHLVNDRFVFDNLVIWFYLKTKKLSWEKIKVILKFDLTLRRTEIQLLFIIHVLRYILRPAFPRFKLGCNPTCFSFNCIFPLDIEILMRIIVAVTFCLSAMLL